MRVFSYVVARDYGFAPNPFDGFCTLATCKPRIRSVAQVGDWVIGTGSKMQNRNGRIVYAMMVQEALSFEEYWEDPRFLSRRPNLRGSKKQAFGDNIYHLDGEEHWVQEDSHHSLPDGVCNVDNLDNDTSANRVLVSTDFIYWGRSAIEIPAELRNLGGQDICAGYGHKSRFSQQMVISLNAWLRSLGLEGYLDEPFDWSRSP